MPFKRYDEWLRANAKDIHTAHYLAKTDPTAIERR